MSNLAIYATPVTDKIPYFSKWIEYLTEDEVYYKDWRRVSLDDAAMILDLYNNIINHITGVNIINGLSYRFIIGHTREEILEFCMQDIQIPDTDYCNIID
jgi:hypothetical protein